MGFLKKFLSSYPTLVGLFVFLFPLAVAALFFSARYVKAAQTLISSFELTDISSRSPSAIASMTFRIAVDSPNQILGLISFLPAPDSWDIAADPAVPNGQVTTVGTVSIDKDCNGSVETFGPFPLRDQDTPPGSHADWLGTITDFGDADTRTSWVLHLRIEGSRVEGFDISAIGTDAILPAGSSLCTPEIITLTICGNANPNPDATVCGTNSDPAVLTNPSIAGTYDWRGKFLDETTTNFAELILPVCIGNSCFPPPSCILPPPLPTPAPSNIFNVNSTCDDPDSFPGNGICEITAQTGACTLRAAIEEANAHVGVDTVNFGIGSGAQTIIPNSALPTITDPVVIDGTTQPGFSGSPIIELSGTNVPGANGLSITSGSSTVKGLVINRFTNSATSLGVGIRLETNGSNTIQGNYIGLDITGTSAQNNVIGILIAGGSSNNTIGGSSASQRNTISGNIGNGIAISGTTTTNNSIKGNFIGTNAAGTGGITAGTGIRVSGSSHHNTIGGTTAGERNLISGNGSAGVEIDGLGADFNEVFGNYIGTDINGQTAVGNGVGIRLDSSVINNTIGGGPPTRRNVISGNTDGIDLHASASFNTIRGNFIGRNAADNGAVPNVAGVRILSGSKNNIVGSTDAAEVNVIAHNTGQGIQVDGVDTTGNTLSINSVFDNGTGIDNTNGGNGELPPPTITATGSAGGTACANCTVDVYSDDGGQGRIYEGTIVADVNGNWFFPGAVTGPNITAIATDANGNSSEFSRPFAKPVDSDGDGILDAVDSCPFNAEDFDGYKDSDGCPELDAKDLRIAVENLENVTPGTKNILLSNVSDVQKAQDSGNLRQYNKALKAFKDQVKKMSGKQLSASQTQSLLALANSLTPP